MKKITVEMITDKIPCKEYTEGKVRKILGKGKTFLQFLDLDIPEKDRIWGITRFLTDKQNRKFAIWCARQRKTDRVKIKKYIDVTEKFYAGLATQEELAGAYSAVDYAADSAAYYAAYSAAYSAAYYAAYYAAYFAAYSADERKKQIKKLKEIVREAKTK